MKWSQAGMPASPHHPATGLRNLQRAIGGGRANNGQSSLPPPPVTWASLAPVLPHSTALMRAMQLQPQRHVFSTTRRHITRFALPASCRKRPPSPNPDPRPPSLHAHTCTHGGHVPCLTVLPTLDSKSKIKKITVHQARHWPPPRPISS